MLLNANLSERVVVDSQVLPWQPSPSPMVQHQPFSVEGCLILVKTGHLASLSSL